MSKILVVDDELKIARLVRDYLTEAGFDVVTASSGPAALAAARSDRPDLVVLDLGLPGMDGYDVTGPFEPTRRFRSSCSPPAVKRRIGSWVSSSVPTTTW